MCFLFSCFFRNPKKNEKKSLYNTPGTMSVASMDSEGNRIIKVYKMKESTYEGEDGTGTSYGYDFNNPDEIIYK